MNMPQSYAEFHRRSIEDRDGFWREQAELIDWHRPFDQVCDYSQPPSPAGSWVARPTSATTQSTAI